MTWNSDNMSNYDNPHEEIVRLLDGNIRALSKLITLVESDPQILASVYPVIKDVGGRSHIVGITGPPGAGKSTLSSALASLIRDTGRTVAILACDPSSPFTGGSVLGDRVRMQSHYTDPGVFIRSISSRGSSGGLSTSTYGITTLLDAFGFDVVLLETVGVGQTELDVMKISDTVVVVIVPESGDSIQAMKAGLMEIADIFVVNKSDRIGADRMVKDVTGALQLSDNHAVNLPPVLKIRADAGDGVAELLFEIDRIYSDVGSHDGFAIHKSRKRLEALRATTLLEIESKLDMILDEENSGTNLEVTKLKKDVELGRIDPISASRILVDLIKNLE